MTKNSKLNTNEIDLIELMLVVWKGKWKIAVVVVISFISMMSHRSIQPNNFTAMTEIKPVKTLEMNKYINFNNLILANNFNFIDDTADNIADDTVNDIADDTADDASKIKKGITKSLLLGLYIDIMNDRSVFEEAMRKFNILDVSQYNNDQEFNEAVIRLASSVKISSSIISANTGGDLETFNYTINFKHDDAEKWKSVLKYVDEYANKIAKKNLLEQYSNTLSFLLEEKGYRLEDLQVKINNFLIDYERDVSDRVAYLKEQSEIAVKLGIAKNTIEVQTFGNQNAMLSNVKTDSPFYLRGYDAINKEIELIELRDDKKAFIGGLFDLEKKKRAIEQDQTIERVKLALQSNLPNDNNEFFAASIKLLTK